VKRSDLSQISGQVILVNLYITQGFAFFLTIAGVALFHKEGIGPFFQRMFFSNNILWDIIVGVFWGLIVVFLQIILYRILPQRYFDDGGINEKLFRTINPAHILFISALVSFVEELLFRGLIQNGIGLFWTSVLFTLIHFRYLQQWLLTIFTFGVSIIIGWIYLITNSLIAPVLTHFLIDAILGLLIHFQLLSPKKEMN
jgi:membrane protease YdiL (CAAX protease family)